MAEEVGALDIASRISSELQQFMDADDIKPGDQVSYALCKAIYIGHPLGAKMAEEPIRLAQSQQRDINVPDSPEEEVVEAFKREWKALKADALILNVATQSRIYGVASIAMGEKEHLEDTGKPVDMASLWEKNLFFNVVDPLNTAGSLVTSQDPNSPLYQKWGDVSINGQRYHRSRVITLMNESPLYISWSASAFGFIGRSVYQRALYPLKSFIQTMRTDDMVTRKAGLLIARLEQNGSIVDRFMQGAASVKRAILKMAQTDNVISIGTNEMVETVNLRNVNESMRVSRENIIKNIATAAAMPAKLLTMESFVEGFGEGTQDAYAVAQYIDRVREELADLYTWFDTVCQYRAWNPEFYETIQKQYPEAYGKMKFEAAFRQWRDSFRATWPDVVKEKPSEASDREKVKLDALVGLIDKLLPMLDEENKARLVQTIYDQLNTMEALFGGAKFELDAEKLIEHLQEEVEEAKALKQAASEAEEQAGMTERGDAAGVVALLREHRREGDRVGT